MDEKVVQLNAEVKMNCCGNCYYWTKEQREIASEQERSKDMVAILILL